MAKKRMMPAPKGQTIKFTLDIEAFVEKDGVQKFELKMNLNPDKRVLQIEERLSSYKELVAIFDEVKRVIEDIDSRTNMYNESIQVNRDVYRKYFNEGYEQNIKPTFEKIDRIHYTRNSPESSNVSYTKSYNGDKRPTTH